MNEFNILDAAGGMRLSLVSVRASLLPLVIAFLNSQYAPYYQGVILPWLIAVLQKPGTPRWFRTFVAIAACVGAALLTIIARGQVTATNLLPDIIITLVVSLVLYSHVYKNLGIGQFEAWTSNLVPAATATTAATADNVTKVLSDFQKFRAQARAAAAAANPAGVSSVPVADPGPANPGTIFHPSEAPTTISRLGVEETPPTPETPIVSPLP